MDETTRRTEDNALSQREQKQRQWISRVVLVLCITAGVGLGLLLSRNKTPQAAEKVFDADGLQLTLSAGFVETGDRQGYDRAYWSNTAGVYVARDGFDAEAGLADLTAAAYAGRLAAGATVQERNGLPWFRTELELDGVRYAALVAVCKGSDAFWRLVFVCKPSRFDEYSEGFLAAAEAVKAP